jgi:hypothetical protein
MVMLVVDGIATLLVSMLVSVLVVSVLTHCAQTQTEFEGHAV